MKRDSNVRQSLSARADRGEESESRKEEWREPESETRSFFRARTIFPFCYQIGLAIIKGRKRNFTANGAVRLKVRSIWHYPRNNACSALNMYVRIERRHSNARILSLWEPFSMHFNQNIFLPFPRIIVNTYNLIELNIAQVYRYRRVHNDTFTMSQ